MGSTTESEMERAEAIAPTLDRDSAQASAVSANAFSPAADKSAQSADTPPGRGAFRALGHRNFRLFWTGQLISLIGTWAQNLAQGWLIVLLVDPAARILLRHGQSVGAGAAQSPSAQVEAAANIASGWVNFLGGLPIFLLTLLAGVVADRVDKRKLLLVTQSCLIGTAFALGLLCVTGRVELWHVCLMAGLSGLAAAFDMPTRQSFVAEMVPRRDLPSAVALNSSIFNAARALGPAVAGLLLAANVSIGAAFLGNAVLSCAVIAGLLMIRVPKKEAPPAAQVWGEETLQQGADSQGPASQARSNNHAVGHLPPKLGGPGGPLLSGILASTREGFAYVRSHPTVRTLVTMVGSFGLFAFSFNVLIPVFVRFTLLPHATDGVQVRAFGFMETVRGVGALGGALTVAVLGNARRQRNMLLIGSLLATVVLLVFAETRTLWLAYGAMAVVSYGFVLCFATSNTLMQISVPDALRGRVMSIYTLMFIGTMPFGSLFAGWLAKFIGAPHTILVCAGVSLLTTLWLSVKPGGLRDIGKTVSDPV